MTLTTGSRLGPYEVIAPIGAGGMGEVWRARDTRLDRQVAVKILPPELAGDAQLRLRFEREAKTISQLNHPNICQLYDVGDNYLVMELIEGESLAERLDRGPLPLPSVLQYGIETADALDRAHRSGIVHRDLKPGNIMITKSGAKLLDFGLAAVKPAESSPHDATAARPLTQEGTILGTFQYMAPEQLEGEQADARTDIFALGCVLYEMLTGKRAFTGKNRTSLIAAIVSGAPRSITELQPLTPPALEHVVQRCLQKDRDERWQSAHDVAAELRWIRDAGSQAGVPDAVTHRRRVRYGLAAAIAAVAIAIGVGTAVYFTMHREKPLSVRLTLPALTDDYMAANAASLSPDSSRFAIAATNRKTLREQIFIRRVDAFDARPIEGTDDVSEMTWSPDGQSIAFVSHRRLQRIDLNGGPPHVLATAAQPIGIAWAGNTIIWGEPEGAIRSISADGGEVHDLTKPDPSQHERGHLYPTFLPDQRHFLFITYTRDPAAAGRSHTLYAASLDSKQVTRIGPIASRVRYVDGQLLFVRDGSLFARAFDTKALKFTGDPRLILDNVACFDPTGYGAFAAGRNGMLLVVPFARPSRVVVTDVSGREIGAVLSNESLSGGLAVSADGENVYLGRVDPKLGTPDIWAYGVNRPTKRQITFEPDEEAVPVLSPDGSRIYYETDRRGVPDIYERPLDGSSPERPVVVAPDDQEPNSVSHDGRYLAYQSTEDSRLRNDIWVAPLTGGGQPQRVVSSPANETDAMFSPDGRWMTYLSDASGTYEVYIRPFPNAGAATQVTTMDVSTPAQWSPDSRRIYFSKERTMYACDIAADGKPGEPKALFTAADLIYSFAVMPDGKRFVIMLWSAEGASPPIRVISGWTR